MRAAATGDMMGLCIGHSGITGTVLLLMMMLIMMAISLTIVINGRVHR